MRNMARGERREEGEGKGKGRRGKGGGGEGRTGEDGEERREERLPPLEWLRP